MVVSTEGSYYPVSTRMRGKAGSKYAGRSALYTEEKLLARIKEPPFRCLDLFLKRRCFRGAEGTSLRRRVGDPNR